MQKSGLSHGRYTRLKLFGLWLAAIVLCRLSTSVGGWGVSVLKRISSLSIGLLLAVFVSAAAAADLPSRMTTKAPPPVISPCVWCGFYIGVNAGYAWGRDDQNSLQTAPAPFLAVDSAAVSTASSARLNADGFTGGVQAGYNWQKGAVVFGVEADINALNLRGGTAGIFPFPSTLPGGAVGPPTTFFTNATSVSTDWLFTGRGRVGWVNDNWLLYATGGVAISNVKVNQTVVLLPPFVWNAPISSTQVGWTVGAGFEYGVAQNWSVKGEYLYVDLGTPGANGVLTPASPSLAYTTSAHITANLVRVGVNYHFGAF